MEIPLTQGKVAVIDDADWPLVSGHKWRAAWSRRRGANTWYAWTSVRGSTVGMHRVIMAAPKGMLVDHRDGDGLNNRRSNLRLATFNQNNGHIVAPVRNRLGYRGVVKTPTSKRFHAVIGKWCTDLGWYDTPEEAARAYDDAAREKYGEFARLNFPREGEQPARRESA